MSSTTVTATDVLCTPLPKRRLGARYDFDAVDDFAEVVAADLQARTEGRTPKLSAEEVLEQDFPPPAGVFGPGYDADAVDDLLDSVIDALRAA